MFHLKVKHIYVKLAPILVVQKECIFLKNVRGIHILGCNENSLKIWETKNFTLNTVLESEWIEEKVTIDVKKSNIDYKKKESLEIMPLKGVFIYFLIYNFYLV